jgi:hypothetical protein
MLKAMMKGAHVGTAGDVCLVGQRMDCKRFVLIHQCLLLIDSNGVSSNSAGPAGMSSR